MKKQLLIRAAATTALALSFTGAMASADISNTGPNSDNNVKSQFSNSQSVDNNNDLGLNNHNSQNANSGDAAGLHSTTAGDATSGDASNDNSLDVHASVDNTGAANMGGGFSDPSGNQGQIDTTGPDSSNNISTTVKNSVKVNNNNEVNLQNNNCQNASTGNATEADNTTGGSATSGGASNSNSASFTLDISN